MDPFIVSAEPVLGQDLTEDIELLDAGTEEEDIEIENEDGSVTVIFGPEPPDLSEAEDHSANLACFLDEYELNAIAEDLLTAIADDDDSRQDWMKMQARGLEMLGLRLEEARGDVGGSAPLEGMATVRHPLLLEAVLRFQANARGELLPAGGPVKVRNDGIGTNEQDRAATALERYMNHYLTEVASEYYPDTDRMLFDVGLKGCAFKKVYRDPILRRPVSMTVEAEDLIVNNSATSLSTSQRTTHRSKMKPSTMRRMQLLGAYLDVELSDPLEDFNEIERTERSIEGISGVSSLVEDQEHTIYECYCELNLKNFEHVDESGSPTGLELPYVVTIEKDSRKILAIRRNWDEEDEMKLPETHFVKYSYVDAIGFYSIGLLHILGNTNQALTASWREMLDAAMFANFPAFLYSESMGRQDSMDFRLAPGQGQRIQTGEKPIGAAVMALPYKGPDAASLGFIQSIAETGQRLGNTAELSVGEGRADVPVGTTLALIEQSAKVMDAVHKRLHAAQASEFKLLKREFKRDPEALWRHRRGKDGFDSTDQLLLALRDYDIVPAADPNTPSNTHRIMKATALQAMALQAPGLFDPKKVVTRVGLEMGIADIESLFAAPKPPMQPPVDPIRMQEVQLKAQKLQQEYQIKMAELEVERQKVLIDNETDRQRLAAETAGWQNEIAVKREIAQTKAQNDVLRGVENIIRNVQGGVKSPNSGAK